MLFVHIIYLFVQCLWIPSTIWFVVKGKRTIVEKYIQGNTNTAVETDFQIVFDLEIGGTQCEGLPFSSSFVIRGENNPQT